MKIYGDKTALGYTPDKNLTQGRLEKTPKTICDQTRDDLELTGKTAPVALRETETGDTVSVDFDVREVPMIKQRLEIISNYFVRNPLEALTIQGNLNSESVAKLLV